MGDRKPRLRCPAHIAGTRLSAPNPLRVNGPLQNFPPFAEAFGIDADAPLRRPVADRVKIW